MLFRNVLKHAGEHDHQVSHTLINIEKCKGFRLLDCTKRSIEEKPYQHNVHLQQDQFPLKKKEILHY